MTLDELYHKASTTPGDIWEHLPTLVRLARECRHVTEFGTRYGISTTAFLHARPELVVAYDIDRHPAVAELEAAAAKAGVDFIFVQANVLNVSIEPTCLLFIDTLHTYTQLLGELERHADKVRKYIVLHDTVTFGEHGETPGSEGLLRAIAHGLDALEWEMVEEYTNNNGLMVFARK